MTAQLPDWFATALEGLRTGDVDRFIAIYGENAVHEIPGAQPPRPARLEGRATIAAYMEHLPERVRFESFEVHSAHEDGDQLIVEAEAHGARLDNNEPFDMRYVWFVTHDGGHVSHFRDYMVPLPPAGG